MIHHLALFLAPEGSVPQAILTSPPAEKQPARRRAGLGESARFVAGVAANAAGFGMLLAGCWFSLQLMSALLQM